MVKCRDIVFTAKFKQAIVTLAVTFFVGLCSSMAYKIWEDHIDVTADLARGNLQTANSLELLTKLVANLDGRVNVLDDKVELNSAIARDTIENLLDKTYEKIRLKLYDDVRDSNLLKIVKYKKFLLRELPHTKIKLDLVELYIKKKQGLVDE